MENNVQCLVIAPIRYNMATLTTDLLLHRRLSDVQAVSKKRKEKYIANTSLNIQNTQWKRLLHVLLQASNLAMYSTVKSATTLVSTPNQILVEIEWTAGTVSSTVTNADTTMSEVVNMCMTKAAVEDVGCSNSWYNFRFHGGRMADDSSCSS